MTYVESVTGMFPSCGAFTFLLPCFRKELVGSHGASGKYPGYMGTRAPSMVFYRCCSKEFFLVELGAFEILEAVP